MTKAKGINPARGMGAGGWLWVVLLVGAGAAVIACAGRGAPEGEREVEEGFLRLFDGETLTGWEGNTKYWSVRDGMIVGKHAGIDENNFLCTTAEFKDFELRLEVMLVGGTGNSGVQIRSKRIEGSTGVIGYQVDIGDLIHWGGLWDESRRNMILQCPDLKLALRRNDDTRRVFGVDIPVLNRVESPERELFLDRLDERGWNTCTIRAVGDHILVKFNGAITVDYEEKESQYSQAGVIGVQVHGGEPMEVRYRNIRIKGLGEEVDGG